jgi:hypothetical protein
VKLKLVPEEHVIKVKKDDKRNTKKRYLVTDGICFRCGCIVNYSYEKRCVLCCGSDQFLVGEHSRVLRELLELDIEQIKIANELRGGNGSGSRTKMVFELYKLIFPKLTKVDERIDENFIRKIIYRNRKRFWYVQDIEEAINDIRRQANKRWRKVVIPKYIRLVDTKDMVDHEMDIG